MERGERGIPPCSGTLSLPFSISFVLIFFIEVCTLWPSFALALLVLVHRGAAHFVEASGLGRSFVSLQTSSVCQVFFLHAASTPLASVNGASASP
jgi:hypothetical protein